MSEITQEQEEAVTREIDAHGEALKRAIENGMCLSCGEDYKVTLSPRAITFSCVGEAAYLYAGKGSCGWSAIYPIRTIGNSEQAESGQQESTMTVHDFALIRRAILTVVDDGCACESGEKHPWEFYEDGTEGGSVDAYTEEMANANRLRFADTVQGYITDRIRPSKGNA